PFVRGGRAEETRVFLNGVPLVQPYHFGSVFSIVNMEAVEHVKLYSGGFPAAAGDALSGALLINTRRPSMDTAALYADLSLFRGNGHVSVPVVKDRLALSVSCQDLWYDYTLQKLLELTVSDSAFEIEMQEYRKYINLPNYRDWQYGLTWKVNNSVNLHYTGISAGDFFNVTIPKQKNYFRKREVFPVEQVNIFPAENLKQAQDLGLDSLSLVDIDNQVHIINVPWTASEDLWLQTTAAGQWQTWDAAFANAEEELGASLPAAVFTPYYKGSSAKEFRLDLFQRFFNLDQQAVYSGFQDHLLTMGGGYYYRYQSFHTFLPLPIYEIIATSNIDLLGGLGYFDPHGFEITRENPSLSAMDYLGEFPRRIRFDNLGSIEVQKYSVYGSDEWEMSSDRRLHFGIRGDYNPGSREYFPSPRASLYQRLNSRNELVLGAGLYMQDHPEFFQLSSNPNLVSEKSLHVNLEWVRALGRRSRLEWSNYCKYSFDAFSGSLVPTGNIDLSSLLIPRPNSGLSRAEIDTIRALLETGPDPSSLPDAVRQAAEYLFGDLMFTYGNAGTGFAAGTELAWFYAPMKIWSGWASLDLSLSRRQDNPGGPFYDYGYHRPWSVNWVNTFRLPGRYVLGCKLRRSAGFAYTPYTGTLNDGGVGGETITVGARNSARYAPYSRFDIRLTKTATVMGKSLETYFEVWNSFNSPNYFLRDGKTGELKFPDLNLPFPFLFFGCIYQW
ncbi:hypothetical protein ACFL5V_08415, partial [Fibrobacterota bacterium]